jgi:adenylate cyclase
MDQDPGRLAAQVETLQRAFTDEQERLLHLQVAIRQMLEEPDININLSNVVDALRALGWRRVMVALMSEESKKVEQFIAVGLTEEEKAAYRQEIIPAATWQQFLNGDLEKYHMGGLYFVPCDDGPNWDPLDLLFAPLRVGQGPTSGVIRIEEPVSGLRPSGDVLRPLDILASQTAYMVQNDRSARQLEEQVEELSMMHQADRELSSHLDVNRIMTLTMDWALRRTGADTGLLMLMTDDRRGLVPSVTIGYVDRAKFAYSHESPMPMSLGIIGRAVRTGRAQVVRDVLADDDYVAFASQARSYIAVPLAMRGEVLGVVALASSEMGAFGDNDVSFLERLAGRAAVALDNARLLRQSEQLADDMSVLYSASQTLTSTLKLDEVLQRIAQVLAVTLECSSAIIYDYHAKTQSVQVQAVYRLGTARDAKETLPAIGSVLPIESLLVHQTVAELHHPLVLRAADPATADQDRTRLQERNIYAVALIPLVAQEELVGLVAVIEGRHDRIFSSSEIFKATALASQASVALRQSKLFSEVLELEKLKSEMIRMASHDLRNPLNNIMGYIELLAMTLADGVTPDQTQYIDTLRRNTKAMRSLLEDLLTLERIESDRQSEWGMVDLSGLVFEVMESQRSSAALKHHAVSLDRAADVPPVRGSETQLRQAIANLVGNAIKYTPDGGIIQVKLVYEQERLSFSVKDNGFGIAPERQARIFERFYRAREPGTDHIGGTGLGLSLVKTVIERHGGQVWFESAPDAGSTFGFWLQPAGEK